MNYLSNKQGFLGFENKFNIKEKAVVVPFGLEKTVSYGGGTRNGPKEIIKASHQVELFDEDLNCEPYKKIGIKTLKPFAIKKTKSPFGFKYIFTLKTEDGMEKIIEFYPRTKKQYFMFDSLPPGTYKFENRQDCLAVRGKTKSNCRLRKTKPIKFFIDKKSNPKKKKPYQTGNIWLKIWIIYLISKVF